MTDQLHALYDESVLDHSRRPRNRRAIDGARRAEQSNVLCGDTVTVHVRVEGGRLADVGFEASACALVVASASMMTEAVTGLTVADAEIFGDRVSQILTTPGGGTANDLGPLAALAGVRQFPIRVRCAWLPWQALAAALRIRVRP